MVIAPKTKVKDTDGAWKQLLWKRNCEIFEFLKDSAPNFLRNPNVRHSIFGTDESSSAFKVASNRDIMEFYVFPKCAYMDREAIQGVCKAWSQWWLESHEYVDEHPRWSMFYYMSYWPEWMDWLNFIALWKM